jgi:hypothetical protein
MSVHNLKMQDEVPTTVVMKSSSFWDITPCSPLKVNRRFGGTCCLHLQGRRIKARKRYEAVSKYRTAEIAISFWFLGLFFDPEDGGDMYLRNVGPLSADYIALYPRRQNSSGSENDSLLLLQQERSKVERLKACNASAAQVQPSQQVTRTATSNSDTFNLEKCVIK